MAKSKLNTFDKFIEDYEPLTFSLLGLQFTEHIPKYQKLLQPLATSYIRLKTSLGLQVSYVNVRPLLTPEQCKTGDLRFITHFEQQYARGAPECPRSESFYYHLLKLHYWLELRHIHKVLYSPQAPYHPDQPIIDQYLLRWGYKLDVSPSFIDLVHGTSGNEALYTLDNLQ